MWKLDRVLQLDPMGIPNEKRLTVASWGCLLNSKPPTLAMNYRTITLDIQIIFNSISIKLNIQLNG